MPQMFPLLWLILFLTVSTSLLMMLSMMFFNLKPSRHSTTSVPTLYEASWKW